MAEFIKAGKCDLVDACFTDPLGTWHHCTFAPSQVTEEDIIEGLAFDGSSIRLFKGIEESDMVMIPDPATCFIDPFYDHKVLHVTCSVHEPFKKEGFSRCPRSIAKRSVEYLKSTGIADTCWVGPEAEFFIFDSVKYSVAPNKVMFEVDGQDGPWNTGKDAVGHEGKANLAHRVNYKQAYFPVPPIDSHFNLRSDMLLTMGDIGVPIEKHHHEVAACQSELGLTCSDLVSTADLLQCYKYVIKNVAKKHGKSVTFMPKPMYGDNGTGMHVHQSLWKEGKSLFFDKDGKYVKLSETCMHYMGGLLKHAPAILAFTNPTTNSYKRLVPGFEAPVNLVYSKGNRSAAIRVPMYKPENPKAKRIEFRCPDPTSCPYIAFAVMLMAGIDGIKNKISPGEPCDFDIYELSKEEREKKGIKSCPGSLLEVLDALEKDHDFLLEGGVFTKDFIKNYIDLKRKEHYAVALIPHPKEYELYYAC